MSGIAELLANLGYAVSGSDARRSDVTARLEQAFGVTVFEGHAAGHVGDADVVVVSSAVRPTNPEIVEARERGIPVIPRAEMLAELMRLRFSIAVAGLARQDDDDLDDCAGARAGGLDPTAVIGGRLSAFGSNARLGRGEYMVAEADESDRSFLMLWPSIAVMTNIDDEHMESYGSLAELQQAFVEFANKVPFYGAAVACADDAEPARHLPACQAPARDLRTRPRAMRTFVGTDVELGAFGGRCIVHRRAREWHRDARPPRAVGARPPQPAERAGGGGRWSAASASISSASPTRSPSFHGAERRFERHGEADGVLVVDDYGHHPTEIAAVMAAARATLDRRLVVAFQPHRYSRTAQLLDAFGPALARRRRDRADRHLRRRRGPDPGHHRRAAGRVDPNGIAAARCTSSKRWTM